jgi:hypothetical protein
MRRSLRYVGCEDELHHFTNVSTLTKKLPILFKSRELLG